MGYYPNVWIDKLNSIHRKRLSKPLGAKIKRSLVTEVKLDLFIAWQDIAILTF